MEGRNERTCIQEGREGRNEGRNGAKKIPKSAKKEGRKERKGKEGWKSSRAKEGYVQTDTHTCVCVCVCVHIIGEEEKTGVYKVKFSCHPICPVVIPKKRLQGLLWFWNIFDRQ